jgi:glutamate racemase
MDKNSPIGVIDSGVGGLTVLRSLQKALPHEHFIYLGDTARTPYGTRSREEITALVKELVDYLAAKDIKQLIVACNTITVLGTDVIRGKHPFHVIGMSRGAALALAATKNKRIGIFATDFTVSTKSHQKAIQALDPEAQVFSQGCTKFVPLIEGEKFGTPELAAAINEYTDILKKDQVDTVLLSCTHYPFVKAEVEKAFGPGVTVIDPAEATVIAAQKDLCASELNLTAGTGHCHIYFTAGLERAQHLAARMLNLNQCDFQEIKI